MIFILLLTILGSILPLLFIICGMQQPRSDSDVALVLIGTLLLCSILFTAATIADRMRDAPGQVSAEAKS